MADGDHNDNARSLRQIVGEPDKPGNLQAEIMMAGAEHKVLPANVTEGTAADIAIELERQRRKVKHLVGGADSTGETTSQAQSRGLQPFARGMVVRHRKSGKTVTIVMASVGTSESGQPKHKVVFPDGETKNVPEGNLERF